jgi:flagellin-like protein
MKKFRRSKKALSPVVASIILIAVTVAVSIAVAAWMGALTIGFMGTEQLSITSVQFPSGTSIQVIANNTGTTSVTINEFWVSNVKQTYTPQTVQSNAGVSATVTYASISGNNYQIKLVSSKGTTFLYNAIAP